jgi:L-alanine-DL-glutamate epimerase-like enolase superfamily enzyme
MRITGIDLLHCALPLTRPVSLGSVTMRTRDYILLKLDTDEGLTGYGIGFRSGTALLETAALLGPSLLGRDPLMRREVLLGMENSMVPGRAAAVRAFSLFDMAMWDLSGKVTQQSVYKLLGGLRTEVPALPVAGFSYDHRAPEDIEEELLRLSEAGHAQIKIMVKGNAAKANAAYVERMVNAVDGRSQLVLETHWSWRHLVEALDTLQRVDDLGLGFIEDPFLPQQWRLAAELRQRLKTPIAIGEDTMDQNGFLDLVQNVDVLRVDATASGGITAAVNAIGLASTFGRACIPHAHPYIHLQLGCALPAVTAVEYIPEESGADPIRAILNSYPQLRNGKFIAGDAPGLGLDVNWDEAKRLSAAVRSIAP